MPPSRGFFSAYGIEKTGPKGTLTSGCPLAVFSLAHLISIPIATGLVHRGSVVGLICNPFLQSMAFSDRIFLVLELLNLNEQIF